jgi:hypothetical protein
MQKIKTLIALTYKQNASPNRIFFLPVQDASKEEKKNLGTGQVFCSCQ